MTGRHGSKATTRQSHLPLSISPISAINNPGTTVYVHWYGKLLQGTVVNDNDLFGMVAVRIPVQGVQVVALFTPAHIYESETAANGIHAGEPHKKLVEDRTTTPCKDSHPCDCPVRPGDCISNTDRMHIDWFRSYYWDDARNHLQTDHLEEFYQLWRAAVADRLGTPVESSALSGFPAETHIIAVDPGSPDGDRSSITITDTATGTIVPYAAVSQQSKPLIETLAQVVPAKLTKSQLRSTGRIQYTDSIQTSLFD